MKGFAAEDARGPAAPGTPGASTRAHGDDADAACSTHAAPGAGAAAHAGAATHAGEQRRPHERPGERRDAQGMVFAETEPSCLHSYVNTSPQSRTELVEQPVTEQLWGLDFIHEE